MKFIDGLLLPLTTGVMLTMLFARADYPAAPGLQSVSFCGQSFVIHSIDPKKDDLRLFLNDDHGNLLRDFVALNQFVLAKSERLVFAANAGMFDPKAKPVGLLVLNGKEQTPLNLKEGAGNFYMKPNGVFLLNEKHEALIVEASQYATLSIPALWATQSGPLLVCDGKIHPNFIEGSANKKIRSGIGVRKDGTVVFALSQLPVNFYDFASLFLKTLECPNALFLDGDISAFYVPGFKDPIDHSFVPMFGVVKGL